MRLSKIIRIGQISGLFFLGCNQNGKVDIQSVSLDFTINGQAASTASIGIPAETDPDVYQAKADDTIRLADSNQEAIYDRIWMIGDLQQPTKSRVCRPYLKPGLHKIQLCRDGLADCVTKYIYVADNSAFVQTTELDVPTPSGYSAPSQKPSVNEPAQKENSIEKRSQPQIEKEDPVIAKEPPKTVPVLAPEGKPATATPFDPNPSKKETLLKSKKTDYFKPGPITGLSSGSYNSNCSVWVERGSISIKVFKPLELSGGFFYSNYPGLITITLKDGSGKITSTEKNILAGRSPVKFTDLDPELLPGKTYTLTVSTLKNDSNSPMLGNVKSCGGIIKTVTNNDIEINYGQDCILFDLKYFLP